MARLIREQHNFLFGFRNAEIYLFEVASRVGGRTQAGLEVLKRTGEDLLALFFIGGNFLGRQGRRGQPQDARDLRDGELLARDSFGLEGVGV